MQHRNTTVILPLYNYTNVPLYVGILIISTDAVQRGWTTWTTTAVDKRVIAQMPVVMSLLNFYKVRYFIIVHRVVCLSVFMYAFVSHSHICLSSLLNI